MTEPNWKNKTIFTGDNLDIMRCMNSETVDLTYLDPPFNSNANYAAPIGSQAAGAEFKDTWGLSDIDLAWHGMIAEDHPGLYMLLLTTREAHGDSMMSYLIYMAIRILEMRRILKPTGSIYLHCDPTASHYLKLVMDCVFGKENFRNEIVWCYAGGGVPRNDFARKHDIVLRFSKSREVLFNVQYRPYTEGTLQRGRTQNKGKYFDQGLRKEGTPLNDWWIDVPKITSPTDPEKIGYPTQKPIALLDRIIKASSNPGDIVFDPFCGCATTCVTADRLQRQWVGIDISPKAADLVVQRLAADAPAGPFKGTQSLLHDIIHRTDIPVRTDLGPPPNYRTFKHTLYGKQEGKCAGCLVHFQFRNLTIDHKVPQSKGGTDHEANLQLLCGACNSTKGAGSQEELIDKLIKAGIR
ncbi:MAG: HNH endonuclease [Alphaproteobacteria bacterium GM202ARS2]|nr:HNH endonuclease [Alphaproteobacteria bacterium GM202ARS2]